ncbi:MAG: tripartite tricarboxylate transporter substrate binding protein [Burkholderiales bacterium]|nr:tripartite tricarboxylate transporter substrate binding protein [Burkholderiales bacterium]
MGMFRLHWRAFVCAVLTAAACVASAQTYPTKPVRIIVPWTAGGTADTLARIMAHSLSESLGQQVLADNRPGASGQIGTELVAKAAPDGYTLVLATTAPNSTAPSLYSKLTYDPSKDFAPISLIAFTFYVLSVNPVVPAKTIPELVKLAKARPGELNFASPGNGTPNHLSGEMFKTMAGIKMQHIPFKGSAQAIAAVIGGQIPINFENIAVVLPHIKAGKVRALGVTSATRNRYLPDVPTIAESGYPGFEAVGWFGLMAPAATPRNVLEKLNADAVRSLTSSEVSARILSLGAEVKPSTMAEFEAFNRAQIVKWAKVIKDSGARID